MYMYHSGTMCTSVRKLICGGSTFAGSRGQLYKLRFYLKITYEHVHYMFTITILTVCTRRKEKKGTNTRPKCNFVKCIISYEMILCFLTGEYFNDIVCRVHRK